MSKKIIAVMLILMMALPLAAFAASKPVPGQPAWDAKYVSAKVVAPSLGPAAGIPDNPRDNASGDKITSNAHSADYPGLYFYWNDKQKDNGVLLVEEWVFGLFKDGAFILTAKNSNNYWGYAIAKDAGQLIGDVYAYGINKQIKYNEIDNKGKIVAKTDDLKNINMVFIDGLYKDGELILEKEWFDSAGAPMAGDDSLVSFKEGYVLGPNVIAIRSYSEAINGRKVTATENPIAGFKVRVNPQSATIKAEESKTLVFENEELPATVIVSKVWDSEDGNEGVVTFTGGWELGTKVVAPGTAVDFYENVIDGWDFASLSINGEVSYINQVDFVAERGATYDIVFTNTEKIAPKGTIVLDKYVDGTFIFDWEHDELTLEDVMGMLSFELYKVSGKGVAIADDAEPVAYGFLDEDGKIYFLELEIEAGWYAVVEIISDEGLEYFQNIDPLYIQYNGMTVVGEDTVAYVSGEAIGGVLISHDGVGVNWPLPGVWNGALNGQAAFELLKDMGAEWIWDVEDTYVYGVSGSKYEISFDVTVTDDVTVPFSFASDNAAIVYVNGFVAGYTRTALRDSIGIGAPYDPNAFGDFVYDLFDGGWDTGWVHSYTIPVALKEGVNTIIVQAANSRQTDDGPNASYNVTNNPCGLIFGMVVPGSTVILENKLIVDPKFDIAIEKFVGEVNIAAWMYDNGYDIADYIEGFELVDEEGNVTEAEIDEYGMITFLKVRPGTYTLVEKLTALGKELFVDGKTLVIEVVDGDIEDVFVNELIPEPPQYGYPDKIESHSHFDKWGNDGDFAGGYYPGGILAGGGNSLNGKVFFDGFTTSDYFLAFDNGIYSEVTIGFGSSYEKALLNSYTFISDDDSPNMKSVIGDAHHAFGGAKQSDFGVLEMFTFSNPHGSGAMHIYLLNYVVR